MTLRMYAEAAADRTERALEIVGLDDPQRAKLADMAQRTPVTLAIKSGVAIGTRLAAGAE